MTHSETATTRLRRTPQNQSILAFEWNILPSPPKMMLL